MIASFPLPASPCRVRSKLCSPWSAAVRGATSSSNGTVEHSSEIFPEEAAARVPPGGPQKSSSAVGPPQLGSRAMTSQTSSDKELLRQRGQSDPGASVPAAALQQPGTGGYTVDYCGKVTWSTGGTTPAEHQLWTTSTGSEQPFSTEARNSHRAFFELDSAVLVQEDSVEVGVQSERNNSAATAPALLVLVPFSPRCRPRPFLRCSLAFRGVRWWCLVVGIVGSNPTGGLFLRRVASSSWVC
jgi:hypothetical protein